MAKLSKEMVERSFKKCGISNALDGTEDDLVWEEEEDSLKEFVCNRKNNRMLLASVEELYGSSLSLYP